MKISLVGPVRGRPQKLVQMWQSAYNLAYDKKNLELCLYIDDDDTPTKAIADYLQVEYNWQVKYYCSFKMSQSRMINKAFSLAQGDLIQFTADDLLFIKDGWDDILREEFAKCKDGILQVYSPDGFQENFPTHCCVHRNVITTLGYAAPIELTHTEYADTWLSDLFTRLGRQIKVEQLYEHLHPSAGKSDMDSTYLAHLNQQSQQACAAEYYSLGHRREEDYQKLKKFIEEFKV